MRKVVSLCTALLLLGAAGAAALDMTSGPYQIREDTGAYDCPGVVKWEQLPNGISGTAAQDDVCYPFLAETADDFAGDGGAIQSVGWWGTEFIAEVEMFRISIYTEDADGCPGELVYTYETPDFIQSEDGSACAELAEPFQKADGVDYCISITAVFCWPPQWYWGTGDGNGQECCFRSDFFGFPDWVPGSEGPGWPLYENAFALFNSGSTPTEDASWTTIKEQYRGTEDQD